jgi:hypothetical protein
MSLERDMEALHGFIDARHTTPYSWGRAANDCMAFVLGAIEAQTGVRVAPEDSWQDERQALRVIARYGSIEAALDAHLVRIAPSLAMRGDVGAVPDVALGLHPMIVEGATLVGPGDHGNRRLPRNAIIAAWSLNGIVTARATGSLSA